MSFSRLDFLSFRLSRRRKLNVHDRYSHLITSPRCNLCASLFSGARKNWMNNGRERPGRGWSIVTILGHSRRYRLGTHLERFIAPTTLPFLALMKLISTWRRRLGKGWLAMHGRDPARESMMNNDGGVMAPRYESISSSLGEITLIIGETKAERFRCS